MRVLGIDCGTEITGFGIAEFDDRHDLRYVACGAIRLEKSAGFAQRLCSVFDVLCALIEKNQPDVVAVEEVFYSVNARSALKLGHVRGVALLSASRYGLPIAEYAPLAIKSAVTGYGRAEKHQVQEMVMRLLKLAERPDSADAADALAIAICHLHTSGTVTRQAQAGR